MIRKVLLCYAICAVLVGCGGSSSRDTGGRQDSDTNTPAIISNLASSIDSDDTNVLAGMVSVVDPDTGEDLIIGQVDTSTTFGVFSILPAGFWDYTLDTTNATIMALTAGETEIDIISIESEDGTIAQLMITINGVATNNNVAVIADTDNTDTGELRYALGGDGPLAAGRLEARVQRQDDSEGNTDAFITLFNSNTNDAGAILDLIVRDDSFGVRNPDGFDSSALNVVLDTFMDVVITWEYPGGDTNMVPTVNVTVDGNSIGPITPNDAGTSPFGGVTHVAFRFGDDATALIAPTDTGRFRVDDIVIYSDTAGTAQVFSEDFEGFADGASLDTDNGASPFNPSTSEATVETEGGAGGGGAPATNNVAVIADTDGTDTGELRYALGGSGPLAQGRLEARVQRQDDSEGDTDAFITLFNSATNNGGAILDLIVRDNDFGVRNPDGFDTAAIDTVHALDTFMDVVITWEYPGGDTNMVPTVNITVDGASIGPITPNDAGSSPFGGVTHVAFRFGDNGTALIAPTDTGRFRVDDIVIYSDTAGTAQVFSEDFEGFGDGDSLDTDNGASPFNASTSEATVETQ